MYEKYSIYNVLSQLQWPDVYASNYFYCHIRRKGLLYEAEREQLAIAKLFCLSQSR